MAGTPIYNLKTQMLKLKIKLSLVKTKSQNSKLTRDEVKKVAKLANIELTDVEVEKFQKQLSEVLAYVEKLKEVETSHIEPTSQVTGLENVFREDEIRPSLKLKKGFFKTPGIR